MPLDLSRTEISSLTYRSSQISKHIQGSSGVLLISKKQEQAGES